MKIFSASFSLTTWWVIQCDIPLIDSPYDSPYFSAFHHLTFPIKLCYLGGIQGLSRRSHCGQQCGLTPCDIHVVWLCWFSTMLWVVFLRVIRFSALLKNQPMIRYELIWFHTYTVSSCNAPVPNTVVIIKGCCNLTVLWITVSKNLWLRSSWMFLSILDLICITCSFQFTVPPFSAPAQERPHT